MSSLALRISNHRTPEQSPFLHTSHTNPNIHSTGIIIASTKYKETMNIKSPSPTKSTSDYLKLCASVLSKA